MNLTSENIQRYTRIVLQWLAAYLVSHGMIAAGSSWIEPVTGFVIGAVSLVWTLYGNRVQAKINEVAKLEVVDEIKVNDSTVANAAPANVTK